MVGQYSRVSAWWKEASSRARPIASAIRLAWKSISGILVGFVNQEGAYFSASIVNFVQLTELKFIGLIIGGLVMLDLIRTMIGR